MPFQFTSLELPDLILIEPKRFHDERGWFAETYKRSDFGRHGIPFDFVQDNHSTSSIWTVRGLHYQLPPHAQGKLVRVVSGRVWDVAVDVRRSSPTFGKWFGTELSGSNGLSLWIPPGFAHGFIALENESHLTYKCTNEYHVESERSILWNDPRLGIAWPLAGNGFEEVRVSLKDAQAMPFDLSEVFP